MGIAVGIELAHGHVMDLVRKGVDAILLPNVLDAEAPAWTRAARLCPWNQTLPFVLRAVPGFEPWWERLLIPTLSFRDGKPAVRRALGRLFSFLGASRGQGERALDLANEARRAFIQARLRAGSEALELLDVHEEWGIVLTGRAYTLYEESLTRLCRVIERPVSSPARRRREIAACLIEIRDRFRRIPVRGEARPLIGVVGEIFCRLNSFSNQELIRRLERLGAEVWLSDVSEWIWYCNDWEARRLALRGKALSFAMLGMKLRDSVQRADEHALYAPFREEFLGREEPERITELLGRARPYLPLEGAMGEMVLSIGKAIYLCEKGADGVIDVSPFTCMNGIVSEALYPKLSREHGGFPVKNIFFDGTPATLDLDLEIFLQLAKSYGARRSRAQDTSAGKG